jgi:myo-inositol-1(or 4)-monophosphatase
LLVKEAGGRISDFDGRDFDIYGTECLASNGRFHAEMQAILSHGRRP